MSSCFRCSVACYVFFAVRPPGLRLAPNETPRGGSDSHQSDKTHLISPSVSELCLISLWKWKISFFFFFPFSISHFPFPIFPLVRQKLYYPQTSPSKDQRMSNIWQLPSIKPTPATKRDHHSHHLHYIHRYILQAVTRHFRHFWMLLRLAYVYVQIYIMGRYITSSDIFNAPEVGSSLTTWLYLTLFTRHYSHYYYFSTLYIE